MNLKDDQANQFSKDASPDWRYFCTEEKYAYQCMLTYTEPTMNTMQHPIPGQNRICRSMESYFLPEVLSKGDYIDYHCPRPYSSYKDVIMNILLKSRSIIN